MSYDLTKKLEKQNQILELIKEDLRAKQTLKDESEFTGLETDLDNAMIQMHTRYLEGRI